ncbi:MAG: chemotaxis response regulator protein-glutamate methylesterase [Desulfobacterales bacterium]|nr:chemotaxis response regulator protein-glutamate methylesterase [Desulfobacterales bacterium]
MATLKILIIDDTIVYRKIVGDVLKEIPGVEIVGVANNGKIALSKIKTLKPDVITLDIEMPEVNGIEVLEQLNQMQSPPVAIMLSTLTQQGSEMTIKALELGAFDFVPKPDQGSMAKNLEKVKQAIQPIIDTLIRQKLTLNKIRDKLSKPSLLSKPTGTPPPFKCIQKRNKKTPSQIIGIGISTGGPNALSAMIPALPANLQASILIVQHMPALFTKSLANSLNKKSQLEVKEAEHGDKIEIGKIYIAPGGKQMKIVAGADGISRKLKITDDPPMNSCKPSADYLFMSIAQHYVGRATGVIMTGMGSDGTEGLIQMKKTGSLIIAQDAATCTVYGMPKKPTESGIADVIAPLNKIADEITKTVNII